LLIQPDDRQVYLLVKAITLPPTSEVLTLLNMKPTVIITTVGNDGSTNAAPFSWFSIVDYNPPRVLFSTNLKRDTYRNVLETKEFVINFPSVDLLKQIWVTSKHFPYGVNELEKADLTSFPSEKVKPPRIRECKAYIECKVVWTKPIGSSCLVLGEIVSVSVDESIERLETKNKLTRLNLPLYSSFRQDEKTREWMFTEIGKIHRIIERDGEVEITSEKRRG
jgi:flavin reductase (DIM6/NTAB) family NADH-FMN oxidoreductase RutF